MSNQPQRPPTRRTNATKELEQYIPYFKQWYIIENRTLEEVGRLFRDVLGIHRDIGTWKSRRRYWGLLKSKSAEPSRSVSTIREPDVQNSQETIDSYLEVSYQNDMRRGTTGGSSLGICREHHPPMINRSFNTEMDGSMPFSLKTNEFSQSHFILTGFAQTIPNLAMPLGDQNLTLPLRIGDPSARQDSEMHKHTDGFLDQPPFNFSEVHQGLVESDWVPGLWQMSDYDYEVAISSQDTGSLDLDALEDQGKWTNGWLI